MPVNFFIKSFPQVKYVGVKTSYKLGYWLFVISSPLHHKYPSNFVLVLYLISPGLSKLPKVSTAFLTAAGVQAPPASEV
jgi:hypothetical protein